MLLYLHLMMWQKAKLFWFKSGRGTRALIPQCTYRKYIQAAAITKQYSLVNPRDYYCVMSVLRSLEEQFYSSKFAYPSNHQDIRRLRSGQPQQLCNTITGNRTRTKDLSRVITQSSERDKALKLRNYRYLYSV